MRFKKFAQLCNELEKTSSRLKKTYILSEFFKDIKGKEAGISSLILLGQWFPGVSSEKIGLSDKLVVKAISRSFGTSSNKIGDKWREEGDLGVVAAHFNHQRQQKLLFSKELSLEKVFQTVRSIAYAEGEGSVSDKIGLLSRLLTSTDPLEARYLVRSVLGQLRTGVAEATVRDALMWAYLPKIIGNSNQAGRFFRCPYCKKLVPTGSKCISCEKETKDVKVEDWIDSKEIKQDYEIKAVSYEEFQKQKGKLKRNTLIRSEDAQKIVNHVKELIDHALNVSNNIRKVAEVAYSDGIEGLEGFDVSVMTPFRSMLFVKAKSLKDAVDALGPKVQAEYKYDGFRMQIHKEKHEVKLFTRNLEDVTKQFPDVVEVIKNNVKAKSCVLDAEIVGIDKKTGGFRPFQSISQRIKRKYDIHSLVREVPVEVNVFDILFCDGNSMINNRFEERREKIENIIPKKKNKIRPAVALVSDDLDKLRKFYEDCLNQGLEGVMIKALDKQYSPGKRVGYGMKVKPVMETLDVVITRAEWGEGKRKGWLTSYYIAVQDKDGSLLEIGKVSTGVKELETTGTTYSQMTELLEKNKTKQEGKLVEVEPKVIIEVNYEEIQKSPTYSSGFALRFPRFIRLRPDKDIKEISTLDFVKELYSVQRGKGNNKEDE